MYAMPEQVAASNKAYVLSWLEIANATLTGAEKIAMLSLDAARGMLKETSSKAAALLEAKDVKDIMAMQTTAAKPTMESIIGYSRSIYEINSETAGQLGKLIEGQYSELYKNITSSLDKAAKSGPAGSEAAISAVKSALAAANSTYDTISKAAKQVVEIAEANVAAATSGTVKAVGGMEFAPKTKKAAAAA